MQYRREPRTLITQLDASTTPRGQAVNPIQVGFHHIKRKWTTFPFTIKTKIKVCDAVLDGRDARRSTQSPDNPE